MLSFDIVLDVRIQNMDKIKRLELGLGLGLWVRVPSPYP